MVEMIGKIVEPVDALLAFMQVIEMLFPACRDFLIGAFHIIARNAFNDLCDFAFRASGFAEILPDFILFKTVHAGLLPFFLQVQYILFQAHIQIHIINIYSCDFSIDCQREVFMDIRIMEYYLAVTREGNISAAAEALHVSQPALSRQIKDLEEELGVTLFERGSRRIRLTEEGMILKRRAEEMVRLMQMTESEISLAHSRLSGEIHIGAGESRAFHYLSETAAEIRREYPDIHFTITSGDTADLKDQLDSGLIDIALIFTDYDHTLYQGISLPEADQLNVLMRRDHPLAQKERISIDDLFSIDLIVPRAAVPLLNSEIQADRLKIAAEYNLIYNASVLVEDGMGCAIGFGHLINVSGDSLLTIRPLDFEVHQRCTLIWKKYQVFTPAVNFFIDRLRQKTF